MKSFVVLFITKRVWTTQDENKLRDQSSIFLQKTAVVFGRKI